MSYLCYVKDVKKREPKLENLLRNKIKPEFKMHVFKEENELYSTILKNLNEHVLELLLLGLEKYKEDRSHLIRTTEQNAILIEKAVREKELSFPQRMLEEARQHLKTGDYVSVVIKASMSLEAWLNIEFERRGLRGPTKRSLGYMLTEAVRQGIITTYEANRFTEVRQTRNTAIHEGKTPTPETCDFVIRTVSELFEEGGDSYDFDLDRFAEAGKTYVGIHNGKKSIDACSILSDGETCRWWDNNSEQPRIIVSGGGGNVIISNAHKNPVITIRSRDKTLRRIKFLDITPRI